MVTLITDTAPSDMRPQALTDVQQTSASDAAHGSRAVGPDRAPIVGQSREQLAALLSGIGVPDKQLRMRVQQLWSWSYVRGARTFEDMTDVSKSLRADLSAVATMGRPEIVSEQVSTDGTRK